MNELSGLELRRAACEALGVTSSRTPHQHVEEACSRCGFPRCAICKCEFPTAWVMDFNCACSWPDPRPKELPAIESDPAVSEPMFLEWCEKNAFEASLWMDRDECEISLFKEGADVLTDGYAIICIQGSTPSEARARAIVAASQVKV